MKKLLLSAGFSENEAELYLALLQLSEGTVDEILKLANVRRPTAYSVMKGLVGKGLIAEIPGKPTRFQMLSPNQTLGSFIDSRLKEIEQSYEKLLSIGEELVHSAQELYEKTPPVVDAERELILLRGPRMTADILGLVESRTRKCIRIISRPPIVHPKRAKKRTKQSPPWPFEGRVLCESAMLEDPDYAYYIEIDIKRGQQFKHLPSLPIKMIIFDDFAATFSMSNNTNPEEYTSLLVQNPQLVKTLTIAFDTLWERAEPVRIEDIEKVLKNAKGE